MHSSIELRLGEQNKIILHARKVGGGIYTDSFAKN